MLNGPRFRVLGPLQATTTTGEPLALRGELQRRLLAALLLYADRTVSAEQLAAAVWPERAPRDVHSALHTHVFRLRHQVGDDVLRTTDAGYRLDLAEEEIDARRFVRLVESGGSDPADALGMLEAALSLWRGTPYEELSDWDDARFEATRLEELRLRAGEDRFDALLALGRHGDAVAELQAFSAAHPLRERPCEQLMQCLAVLGRTAEALRVYESYRRTAAEELGIEPSSTLRRLEQQILDQQMPAVDPTAPPGVQAVLPRPATRLLGRDDDVAAVTAALGAHRLVTLVGPGGIGKTRLALEVAHRHKDAGAVWFCDLTSVTAADAVVAALANTLGVYPRAETPLVDSVVRFLAATHGLLVVDNCEHVLDAIAPVLERVVHETEVQLLTTSRERLAVDGEHLLFVSALGPAASSELFVERARAVRPDFAVDPSTADAIAEVCSGLDHLPLAVELAAARLQALDIGEIAAALDRRFRLLTGGRRSVVRHRSLRAAVDWSYELLGPDEREVFEHLAVFVGSFDVDAVAAVVDRPIEEVEPVVLGLVDRSLVVPQRELRGTRFALLETLRQYAAERLIERGALETATLRHSAHYVTIAERANDALRDRDGHLALDIFDTDMANLRAAYTFLLERQEVGSLSRLVTSMHLFALFRMRPEVLDWAAHAAEVPGADDDERYPRVLAMAGTGAWQRGELARADEYCERALRSGGVIGQAATLAATLALVRGELDDVLESIATCLAAPEMANDQLLRTVNRTIRVQALAYRGDARAATDEGLDILAESEPRGNVLELMWTHYVVGEALLEVEPARARVHVERALELAHEARAAFVLGVAGVSAASLELRHGDPRGAVTRYRHLVELCRGAGVWAIEWTILRTVVELLARLDANHDAAVLLGAIEAATTGVPAYGADAQRLAEIADTLRKRLGDEAFDAALGRGAAASDEEAVRFAAAALDRLDTDRVGADRVDVDRVDAHRVER